MTVASDSIYSYKSFWAYLAEELDLSALPRPEEGLVSIGIDSLAVFEISVVASELACSSHNPVPMSAFGLELKDAREITGQDVYLWYVEMKASLGAGGSSANSATALGMSEETASRPDMGLPRVR